jgi:hypothetical protein
MSQVKKTLVTGSKPIEFEGFNHLEALDEV